MNNFVPLINPNKELKTICTFLKQTFEKQHVSNAILGLSGGIDSATVLYVLTHTLSLHNIIVLSMPYDIHNDNDVSLLVKEAHIPKSNIHILPIKQSVDIIKQTLNIHSLQTSSDRVRFGNIAARIRMITLFDFAKKYNAMVVGTENKSEHHLGYFTRFGDNASDIEPIRHLYKTNVYELAHYLHIPNNVIQKKPSANLWEGQTDEGEFGFTYREADNVLYLYLEKKLSITDIVKQGFPNAEKIIQRVKHNKFKHNTPYIYKLQ